MTVSTGGQADIWIYEIRQGLLTRLTTEGQQNDRPEWMPDGRSVLFRSNRGANNALWVQPVDNAGSARLLYSQPAAKVDEGVVSPDGKFLLFQSDSTGIGDLWYTALAPDSQPHPVATSTGAELSARFSPDGKWIAYTSSESGATQVYVRPFPSLATRYQVSLDGGATPVWSHDGQQLYYVFGRTLLSANLNTSPAFAVLKRRVVSENVLSYQVVHADYDVFPNGRVIGLQPTEATIRVLIVHNWATEVRERLSGRSR
jgi:Tol biopolymer transport system component